MKKKKCLISCLNQQKVKTFYKKIKYLIKGVLRTPFFILTLFIDMTVNFKNILVESIIDDLNIDKFDKGILKMIHTLQSEYGLEKSNFSTGDADLLSYISETLSYYDYDRLVKILKFYKKYSDIIFSNSVSGDEMKSEIKYPDDEKIVQFILLLFFYKNYYGKTIDVGEFHWEFTVLSDDIEEAISEEAFQIEIVMVEEPYVSTFVNLLPNSKGIGCDMISFDEGLAIFNAESIRGYGDYDEVIGSKYITGIEKPKDLKDSTLKQYFDDIIKKVKGEVIEKNLWKIESYNEYVRGSEPPR